MVRKAFQPILNRWLNRKFNIIKPYLPESGSILDLGSGNCLLTDKLEKEGLAVTPVDVKDLSVVEHISPMLYDGAQLPFDCKSFRSTLLLTVLHHTEEPELVIHEAKRVTNELVIVEDTYNNRFQKWMTQTLDFIVNMGHSKMTYMNKSENEWEALFARNGLNISGKQTSRVLFFFQQTTYHLSVNE